MIQKFDVIPAKAGIQKKVKLFELLIFKFSAFILFNGWIPAFAGMTSINAININTIYSTLIFYYIIYNESNPIIS
ncbi:hypothetical protein H6P87_00502 [Rickettsia tillamookensis]|uniref:Uncharacterized protein n=1 Tax=Rickettsia tillamookensis TaxID=2761623 RepID=A0A9E6MH34_9RICK|nr:hypothetical protein H6P87_00502 [Rickettsia tillamookensis]